MFPSVDGSEDPAWIGGPHERLGLGVVLRDVAVYGRLEVDNRAEHSSPEPLFREPGKEGHDRIVPGASGWGKVEHEAGVA